MKLWWYDTVKYEKLINQNAGDYFNKWLFEQLGFKVEFTEYPEMLATGSILRCSAWQGSPYIWGTGFHNDYDDIRQNIDLNKIKAVRGELTKNKLKIDNVVLGDPGLLASYFYRSRTTKKYKYGFIPHYTELKDFKNKFGDDDCIIINILTSDIEDLFSKISECEFIFSSSLHGLIFSHSLGIPAVHVENKQLYSLNNFKFKDYYSVYKNIKYIKEPLSSLDINKYLNSDFNLYKPSQDELIKIQNNLLECFPYKIDKGVIK